MTEVRLGGNMVQSQGCDPMVSLMATKHNGSPKHTQPISVTTLSQREPAGAGANHQQETVLGQLYACISALVAREANPKQTIISGGNSD